MILVTGGAGFIGSHVVDALLQRDENVICIDDLNDYYDPRKKQVTVERHRKHPKYTFYKIDIRDFKALEQVFDSHEIATIIHLAARAGVRPSIENPFIYTETNIMGTLNLLELAKRKGIKNFVNASSSSVYGNSSEAPFSEHHKVDEPISPYAATKKASENIAHTYSHLHGLNVTNLRFFTVYGPRGRPDMAPYLFIDAVHKEKPLPFFGDGTTARDYTFVKDIVDGILAAHDRPRRYATYNLGNNKPITLNEFIQTVEKIVGKPAKLIRKSLQPGDVTMTCADIQKAREELGYEPKITFEEGLRELYRWYIEEHQ